MNEPRHVLPKINIISPIDNPESQIPSTKHQLVESFLSDSYNSSFNSSLDPDIQQIKDITEALDRGIKSKLTSYKRLSHDLGEGITTLKEKFQECAHELDTVKINVADLLSETSQTHQFIKELREKELANPQEDLLTSYSQSDFNIPEALKKMKEEIETMQKKMENKEAEYLKTEEEFKAKYMLEHRLRQRRPKSELCGCRVF